MNEEVKTETPPPVTEPPQTVRALIVPMSTVEELKDVLRAAPYRAATAGFRLLENCPQADVPWQQTPKKSE